ncbi:MAG: reverse transcriptase family protein [Burkholderiales bacterium]
MTTAKLKNLISFEDVASTCGVEPDFIEKYSISLNQTSFFDVRKLPKHGYRRKGEYRVVFEAREHRLAAFHRAMSMIVTNSVIFDKHVQGFMKKRSTRTNAEQHLAAKVLLHADIKGFFDAITTKQVKNAFVEVGATVHMADSLAKACTIDGLLRQGTRCSPVIANLVCLNMDQSFLRLAHSYNCIYTRYADDLTFSGDLVPPDESIRGILENQNFELRDNQCYRQYRGRSQYVTGLTIADSNRPRLPSKLKRSLRLMMHYIEKHGLDDHWKRVGDDKETWLWGMLKYAGSIEPQLVSQWQNIYDKALSNRHTVGSIQDHDNDKFS